MRVIQWLGKRGYYESISSSPLILSLKSMGLCMMCPYSDSKNMSDQQVNESYSHQCYLFGP